MSERANESGIKTINGVFGESSKLIDNIKENYTSFDFIFANNVVNHSNNPIKFISDVSSLLSPKGFFIFEVPYWLDTIKTYRFDQIYHEHITYFTIESAEYLLNQAGLGIHDVSIVSYHGSSLRIFASKKKFDSDHKKNLLQTEKDANLKNLSTYINYSKEIEKIRSKFLYELSEKENKVVFGIGAAAKANTFLTYYGIDYSKMNFILDSSPFKIGKITPVTLIPIVPDSNIKDLRNGLGVVLAWNLKKDLKNRLLSVNTNLEFMDSFDKI
jgi:SAM-dependent methyltransferase